MSDDYLWDGSGEPDPEVQKLEEVLGRLRSERPAPSLPASLATASVTRIGDRRVLRRRWVVTSLAAAAVLTVVGALALRQASLRRSAWEVASLAGSPTIDAGRVEGTGHLAVGEWLETDGASRARLSVGTIGEVVVEPNTRLRILTANRLEHRLSLAQGTMHATISAPPRLFLVETPSAVAVDLGCAYTLEVDPSGSSVLSVQSGWVSFERDGHESYVPAGARCSTRPGSGPGTPFFDDAPQAMRDGLDALDFQNCGTPGGEDRRAALAAVLDGAREADALTLWHLLARLTGAEREAVYDRMAALAPPPSGVTRQGVLTGDRVMLDRWWDTLGFGQSPWRRAWKRVAG